MYVTQILQNHMGIIPAPFQLPLWGRRKKGTGRIGWGSTVGCLSCFIQPVFKKEI